MEDNLTISSGESIFDKPIEYYVAQSINPYSSKGERKELWNVLCQRIMKDIEGPQIVAKCFSHKLTSPDHNEVSITLDVIEYCLRICGYSLAVDLGKYKFLNSMIKLLSPKYLGNETPKEIKDKVIILLYGWQKYIEHIGKFKEVYMLLKKQNLIVEDPKVHIDDYVIESKKPVKMACFEDEEKSKLLASLLASKKIEDLQAANRLIKSLVKSEEKKTEKKIKMLNDVEEVKKDVCIFYELLNNYSSSTTTPEECRRIGMLYDKLSKFQPIIQRYANETDECEDDFLGNILDINDDILQVTGIYDKLFNCNNNNKLSHNEKENGMKRVTWSDESEESSLEAIINDDDDILNIWSRQTTPKVQKKIMKPVSIINNNKNLNYQDDGSNINSERNFNDKYNLICDDLQDLEFPSPNNIQKVEFKIKENEDNSGIFLDNFSLDLNDLEIDSRDPLTIFDLYNVKIILYYTKPRKKLLFKNINISLITITNFNTHPLSEIKFLIQSCVKIVNFKLEKSSITKLEPFNPFSSVKSINQLFYALPLSDDISEGEFNFQLFFILKDKRHEEFGRIKLKLK